MKNRLKNKLRKKVLGKIERKVVGYHLYRSVSPEVPFIFWERITDEPVPEGAFSEPGDSPGTRYYYKTTQVYADGTESKPISAKTTYTDHAGNQYEQNPLVDFVGYNIYRSADASVPLDQWERRNKEPLKTTSFTDEGVQSGEIYYYYVRAVDSRGTESAPGEVVRVLRK
jgi:hypothetical protein